MIRVVGSQRRLPVEADAPCPFAGSRIDERTGSIRRPVDAVGASAGEDGRPAKRGDVRHGGEREFLDSATEAGADDRDGRLACREYADTSPRRRASGKKLSRLENFRDASRASPVMPLASPARRIPTRGSGCRALQRRLAVADTPCMIRVPHRCRLAWVSREHRHGRRARDACARLTAIHARHPARSRAPAQRSSGRRRSALIR